VNSELVPPYWSEPGVNPESKVETYALLKILIDNNRWRGVPIYLRTGKRMPSRKTEIFITLKSMQNEWIPGILNKQHPIPNTIRLEIQPRAGIDITIGWKPAGLLTEVVPINLNLGGKADMKEPKAYERLLIDALRGDSTLFIRYDEIREMWKIVDPIVKYWNKKNQLNIPDPKCIIHQYPAGTQGPKASDEFILQDNISWNKI